VFGNANDGPVQYFATKLASDEGHVHGEAVEVRWLPWAFQFTPVRFSPEWKSFLGCWGFDRAVAHRLVPGAVFTGFSGAALISLRRARRRGYRELHLESPTAHVLHARRRFDAAFARHPIERDWLAPRLLARTLAEYELADVIWVNSEYALETFVAQGVPKEKLRRRHLTVDPRFRPPHCTVENPGLHVVYVGSLTVTKGIPLLLEAFAEYSDPLARLTLVGGTGTRGMARWLSRAMARDPRVRVSPGDPLPHLQSADVCVHPSYSDGFGYAPMEALACGVPVIVTSDTGMSDQVLEGRNGYVIPRGSSRAILERLEHIRRYPLKSFAPSHNVA
jgi:glycosyltransferase involved in cell wall biosynthesis